MNSFPSVIGVTQAVDRRAFVVCVNYKSPGGVEVVTAMISANKHRCSGRPPSINLCLAYIITLKSIIKRSPACQAFGGRHIPPGLVDGELLHRQVRPHRPPDRVHREIALHLAVVQGVVQGSHDHGLVEDQVAMPHLPGHGVDGVEETVGAVNAGVQSAQLLDVVERLLR